MNSTHAHFNVSAREIGARLKPHGSVCPPFWILRVEWSGAWSCLFWWRHRFQIASFSPSILENSVFWKSIVFKSLHSGERFRMAPFSVIVFGVVVWTIAFENGLVWTRPVWSDLKWCFLKTLFSSVDGENVHTRKQPLRKVCIANRNIGQCCLK